MVGRLVEQQHVGLGEQQTAQCDAALFTARQGPDLHVPRRQTQRIARDIQFMVRVAATGIHDGFVLRLLRRELVKIRVRLGVGRINFVELFLRRRDVAQGFFDRLAHGFVGIELRLLRQKTHAQVRHRLRVAVEFSVHASHDLEQTGFAGSVNAEHADFRAGKKREGNVLEYHAFGRNHLVHATHAVNVLSHVNA